MKTSKRILTVISVLLFVGATAAFAHTDEYLATLKAPHGGQLRMTGPYHLELVVVKDSAQALENPLFVYVTDHAGTAIPVAGGSGNVTLLGGGTKATATLVPAGGNAFKAAAVYSSSPDLKAVVSITMPGQPEVQARFSALVDAPKADDHASHH